MKELVEKKAIPPMNEEEIVRGFDNAMRTNEIERFETGDLQQIIFPKRVKIGFNQEIG